MKPYINTMIFRGVNSPSYPQSRQTADCAAAGYPLVEVRRELFFRLPGELSETGGTARDHGVGLLYSVPAALFGPDGAFLHEAAAGWFREAAVLGARAVKLSLGEYQTISDRDLVRLDRLTRKMPLLVENGPTGSNGSLYQTALFLDACAARGLPVGHTFDVGNYARRGIPLAEAAAVLAPHVRCLHLKDLRDGVTVPLGQGDLDLSGILDAFPQAWAALEYPCGPEGPLAEAGRTFSLLK